MADYSTCAIAISRYDVFVETSKSKILDPCFFETNDQGPYFRDNFDPTSYTTSKSIIVRTNSGG
jgi:hypothetical protein